MDSDSLKSRHDSEANFHDRKYSQPNTSPKHYSYGPTYRIFQRMKVLLGDVRGKGVLEYGCGNGWMTAELAGLGCNLSTFDISEEAIISTRSLLAKRGVLSNVKLDQMAAEKLNYADNSFDVIFGFAILHHLDLDQALSELYRVMKPGGVAIFAEPLESNPAIQIYRKLTPQYRTPDEEPIKLKSFKAKLSRFSSFDYESFYLVSLLAFVFVYIPKLSFAYEPTLKILMKFDDFLFKLFPSAKKLAWYSIFEIRK
ncbi:class I SAM-dependent methyltransferase [Marinobacter salarius]|jgi:SAM-dependent methyltransferase|nr:class I SAM-dependent methyltransferase [Marinobacter salarius]MDP4532493.1 class I SAM-dependent methyltransferase [Marinobacter salarius]